MAGLPSWFQYEATAGSLSRCPLLGQFWRQPLLHPYVPAGSHRATARSYYDLEYGRMELATLCPVNRGGRRCLEHLQEGLSILHGAHAVEDYDAFIATTNGQGSISFTSSTSRTWPLPSNVVPA
jgi:hypothetical protein